MKNKLKEIREKAGISQDKLAKLSGISRTTISKLENNKENITTNKILEKVANTLKLKVTDIFFID